MSKIFALIGPSGAGKSSIASSLGLRPIVSMTTRPRRASELHGHDYYFVTKEEYLQMLNTGNLVEHVENYGNFYGVPKAELSYALVSDELHFIIVTYEGLQTLKETIPGEAIISIFIYSPLEDIICRLQKRVDDGDLSEDACMKRLALYRDEVNTAQYCDFIVPSLEGCLDQATKLVKLITASCN